MFALVWVAFDSLGVVLFYLWRRARAIVRPRRQRRPRTPSRRSRRDSVGGVPNLASARGDGLKLTPTSGSRRGDGVASTAINWCRNRPAAAYIEGSGWAQPPSRSSQSQHQFFEVVIDAASACHSEFTDAATCNYTPCSSPFCAMMCWAAKIEVEAAEVGFASPRGAETPAADRWRRLRGVGNSHGFYKPSLSQKFIYSVPTGAGDL